MLRQMERSAIHVLHKRGLSQRQIAKELGVNRETVAQVLKDGVVPPPLRRHRPSMSWYCRRRLSACCSTWRGDDWRM